jgi:16S rRNA A1518/A1519 N6-dimethyltransferase RsmA/KsgA/DIM1 with predicted DNA glycosylase/AP lyase activity
VVFRMVSEKPMAGGNLPTDQEEFPKFVKHCFAHKRKNLANNLAGTYPRPRVVRSLTALALPGTTRAEQLTIEQFTQLFEALR